MSLDSIRVCVCLSIDLSIGLFFYPSVGWLVRNMFFLASRNKDGKLLMPCIQLCFFITKPFFAESGCAYENPTFKTQAG